MVMKSKSTSNMISSPWIPLILIAVITLMVYSNTYKVPFVFDGKFQIEKNETIRDLKNYFSLKGFKSHRPIVAFSFALNYQLGKLNPVGYHLLNILVHLTNGILVYFLARNAFGRLFFFQGEKEGPPVAPKSRHKSKTKSRKPVSSVRKSKATAFSSSKISAMSLWVALLFVAHPLQTQAVTYIVQRYTSMSAMFYLTSLLLYIQARNLQLKRNEMRQNERKNGGGAKPEAGPKGAGLKISFYFTTSVLAGVFAFLCKENAATLPGVILLVEYFLFDRSWQAWKKKLIWIVPLSALLAFLALYFLSSTRGLKLGNLLEDVSILTRETQTVDRWSYLCTQFNVLVEYIRLLFFPLGQNVDPMVPFKKDFFDGFTPLMVVIIMAVMLVGVWNIRKRAAISFGIFWFFITLSIESSIFPISDAMFEHRLYLPLFGFAFSTVYMVFEFFSHRRVWRNLFLGAALIALGVGTYLRNNIWQDPLSLWADSVHKNPNNYRAHNNLGAELNDRGNLSRAVQEYSKALEIRPDFADANNNLGNALIQQGQFEEASQYISRALKENPRFTAAYNNMGVALASKGDLDGAIRHFRKALRRRPAYSEAHNSLGNALAQKGRVEEAMKEWTKAAELNPRFAQPHYNMGLIFERQGDVKRATECFSDAVRIDPDYAQAYSKLGFIAARQGDYKTAADYFSKALEINPRLADAQKGFRATVRLSGKGN
jgi:Tfp pilus assembly protein PilF